MNQVGACHLSALPCAGLIVHVSLIASLCSEKHAVQAVRVLQGHHPAHGSGQEDCAAREAVPAKPRAARRPCFRILRLLSCFRIPLFSLS
jgi:hypothetical protein